MKQFSFSTIRKFDTHILKSVDGYGTLNKMVVAIARYFVEAETNIYDIGCSTGRLLYNLDREFKDKKIRLYGLEKEINFTRGHRGNGRLSFVNMDVTGGFKFTRASLVLSVFTLQFIPREDRRAVLEAVYEGLLPGGAFILAEKIYSENALVQEIMTFLYYDFKRENFTYEEILQKERDLRSLLRPSTLQQNIVMLRSVGFRVVEVFWRHYNFVALLCVKG